MKFGLNAYLSFSSMFKYLSLLSLLSLFSLSAIAAPEIAVNSKNIAVGGYDPVAYFEQKRSIRGKKTFQTEYKGATFQFSSTDNLELFKGDPEKYLPQYGGYCAFAMAKGQLAEGKGRQWRIVDGKLYLNFSSKIKKKWDKRHGAYIATADKKWENKEY